MSLKVCYLDDEIDLLEMFSDLFSQPGREIITFSDPLEAVTAIQKNVPDIFFVDYRLPGISGEEIARKLDPKIPKVLISGDIHIESDYPFRAVFSKPFDAQQIEALLSQIAQEKRG